MVDEAKLIAVGGRPYRSGFLNAVWGDLNPNDPKVNLRAKRENILLNPRELFHYTSLAGLMGIITENGFWASDNRFMNDAEENLNGIRLAGEVLRHRRERTKIPAYSEILGEVDGLVSEPREHGHLVACFSHARDDLGQWRGYAAGGVCLCLGPNEDGEAPLFFGPDHLPFAVIYKDRPKKVLLFSILKRFEKEYALDREMMSEYWPQDHDENYRDHIHSMISNYILGFKDQAFENEAEARLVLSYKNAEKYTGGLNFRASPLGIIPYLRTGDHVAIKKAGGRLPLREVVIGPAPHQKLIAESVETFLAQSGYKQTRVSLSTVPFRAP